MTCSVIGSLPSIFVSFLPLEFLCVFFSVSSVPLWFVSPLRPPDHPDAHADADQAENHEAEGQQDYPPLAKFGIAHGQGIRAGNFGGDADDFRLVAEPG